MGLGVVEYTVPDFPGEVEAPTVVFQEVHNAQALLIVVETTGRESIEGRLLRYARRVCRGFMAEGRWLSVRSSLS